MPTYLSYPFSDVWEEKYNINLNCQGCPRLVTEPNQTTVIHTRALSLSSPFQALLAEAILWHYRYQGGLQENRQTDQQDKNQNQP